MKWGELTNSINGALLMNDKYAPKWLTGAAPSAALRAIGGALLGRYVAAPVASWMAPELDRERLNRLGLYGGAGLGALTSVPSLYAGYRNAGGMQGWFNGKDNWYPNGLPPVEKRSSFSPLIHNDTLYGELSAAARRGQLSPAEAGMIAASAGQASRAASGPRRTFGDLMIGGKPEGTSGVGDMLWGVTKTLGGAALGAGIGGGIVRTAFNMAGMDGAKGQRLGRIAGGILGSFAF